MKFNDHIEMIDIVLCQVRLHTMFKAKEKTNNIDKETRTIQQLRDDMQWILRCKLGATRGRAMAMLMDSQYECSDGDEAHLHTVRSPKTDLKVRMKSDEDLEEDLRAELFEDHT